jgi:hypothetical protein
MKQSPFYLSGLLMFCEKSHSMTFWFFSSTSKHFMCFILTISWLKQTNIKIKLHLALFQLFMSFHFKMMSFWLFPLGIMTGQFFSLLFWWERVHCGIYMFLLHIKGNFLLQFIIMEHIVFPIMYYYPNQTQYLPK